jgi:hypothetical protein
MTDPRFPHALKRGSFGCISCGLDFASEEAFDGHRHFTGRRGDWTRRGCVDVQAHEEWVLDPRSRWTTKVLRERAKKLREHYSEDPSES